MKIQIIEDYVRQKVSIYWVVDHFGKPVNMGFNGEHLIQEDIDYNDFLKKYTPLTTLPVDVFDLFVQEIIKYSEKKGLKLESDYVLQGKLMSTEKHLDDMREISTKLLEVALKQLKKL